jgi:serine/threonine protein kinase/tetratricopeptide (TPR) repeat protein
MASGGPSRSPQSDNRGSERRRQIEGIVTAVLRLPKAERAAYLGDACAGDPELRCEVDSMIARESEAHQFLEVPALEAEARALAGTDDSIAGQVISHYRILEKIGAGGMGVVYKGQDLKLGRLVALKILPGDLSFDHAAVQRFQLEARAASALNHPHICTVHEIDEDQGKHFIVMELLEGQTLRDRMAGNPMDNASILGYAIQIVGALAAAHAKNIVHRDLKPTNIHLTGTDQIKLLDFGLAKLARTELAGDASSLTTATQSMTAPHTIMGTLPYMSPEQVMGREVDHRTDIFSLGVVLYEMSTGRLPFQADTKTGLMVKIAHDDPPAIAPLNPRLSGALARIIGKCLEKDREKRYPSSLELLADLKKLEEGRILLPRRRVLQIAAITAALASLPAIWTFLPAKWRRWLPGAGGPRITRLAVLPLANLSGDSSQEYFADGMTEILIADLTQIGSLRVISRASAMQFKSVKKPLPEIAKQLDVEAVVTGSVTKSGERIRITAELIDSSTDQQLWAQSYERRIDDVLTLQSEVAQAIAGEIRARMTAQEAGRLARTHTVSPAALDTYLQGRYYQNLYEPEPLAKSVEYYEQAVRLDPGYAAAWAGLAEALDGLYYVGAQPFEEVMPRAREAATKALAIDPQLAEAHNGMGSVYYNSWNWKDAETEMNKAIELNPGLSLVHVYYATVLRRLGRDEEGIAHALRAVELDPLSMLSNSVLGDVYLDARRYDQAIAQYKKALDLHPNDSTVQSTLGLAYLCSHMYDQAIEAIRKSVALDGIPPGLSPDLAYAYAVMGKTGEARQILRNLLALAQREAVQPGSIAIVSAALGEREQALDWLEKAYSQHSSMMTWLKTDPRFDSIRQEPRFQELMRRVGLI